MSKPDFDIGSDYSAGFSVPESYEYKSEIGLNEQVICDISAKKNEPLWMLELRLKALQEFMDRPLPKWGPDLSALDVHDIYYYVKPVKNQRKSWDDVPDDIKNTFDRLGVPQSERKYLAGLGAQYESEVVYHNLKQEWEELGVIFLDTDSGLKEHPELFQKYFGTAIPYNDNKFAALNTAAWSGGSFIYIPKGVEVTVPLQTYFRINAERMGQFERTLIIADEGSLVNYVEGCTAPNYSSSSLHAAVVEIIALKGARVRYTTIQNWSKNVYNLVTKRAIAHEDSVVEWIDGNLGSAITMKYPCVVMQGKNAKAEVLSIAMASGDNQIQDAGAKVIHNAPNTSSRIVSKSICTKGGQASYRGAVKVAKGATNCKSFVQCDALILDEESRTDTYPYIDIQEDDVSIGHEATVSKIGEDQLFYLTSKGIDESTARTLIVNGFIEPFVKQLPMEYAVEMNRLIELEMEGSVG
ncbi:MAG: Fe-S cluster assembly protein SufB [Epsilonproteobacteria bacterium]|nr:Fe-S cluster assembly protein SufB [Campylobacterota bacterium]